MAKLRARSRCYAARPAGDIFDQAMADQQAQQPVPPAAQEIINQLAASADAAWAATVHNGHAHRRSASWDTPPTRAARNTPCQPTRSALRTDKAGENRVQLLKSEGEARMGDSASPPTPNQDQGPEG